MLLTSPFYQSWNYAVYNHSKNRIVIPEIATNKYDALNCHRYIVDKMVLWECALRSIMHEDVIPSPFVMTFVYAFESTITNNTTNDMCMNRVWKLSYNMNLNLGTGYFWKLLEISLTNSEKCQKKI